MPEKVLLMGITPKMTSQSDLKLGFLFMKRPILDCFTLHLAANQFDHPSLRRFQAWLVCFTLLKLRIDVGLYTQSASCFLFRFMPLKLKIGGCLHSMGVIFSCFKLCIFLCWIVEVKTNIFIKSMNRYIIKKNWDCQGRGQLEGDIVFAKQLTVPEYEVGLDW